MENEEGKTFAPGAEAGDETLAVMPEEGVREIRIEEEMRKSYIDYSMSVIVGRALPDVRDGMKPVHRRCIYAMGEMGNTHSQPYKKAARVVGDVMGKYHPHGDSSIYETIVRMAQPFSMRYMLVDGHGNFGSIDGDGAAAMRYTEVRMQRYAEDMLEDLDKETVDMVSNYDETLKEPTVLPSRIPNLLLNGAVGIAVGMSTNIPTHNIVELCDAISHLVDNPGCTIDDLMQYVKGPDFPTGGIICGVRAIEQMYKTGRGSLRVRGRAEIEENGRSSRIVITEIPYGVVKSEMLEKIAVLVRNKELDDISDIRDVSKADIRIEIDLKSGARPNVVLSKLYAKTQLQTSFGAIMLALDHGRPKVMNLKQMLRCFVDHRVEVITRRTEFDLRKAKERCHILEGLRIAIDHMDEVVQIIRTSKDDADARARLSDSFGLSELQCSAILDMRLRQLTGLARDKIEEEYRAVLQKIDELTSILSDHRKVLDIIKNDCEDLKVKYGDRRLTEITYSEGEVNYQDMIPNVPCIITLSTNGIIKRMNLADFGEQNRGGKGKRGAKLREDEIVDKVHGCMAHDTLLFFTSHGRLFRLKAWEIDECQRNARGRSVHNYLGRLRAEGEDASHMMPAERVLDIISIGDFDEDKYVFFATAGGIVKKTPLSDYKNVSAAGIRAVGIRDGDELVGVTLVTDGDTVVLVSTNGQSVRFKVSDVRSMGRTASGVRGMRLTGAKYAPDEGEEDAGDDVPSGDDVDAEAAPAGEPDAICALVREGGENGAESLLVMSENGYGKCTKFDSYPLHHRGGKGVKSLDTGERNGKVVYAAAVCMGMPASETGGEPRPADSLLVMTRQGMTIRLAVDSIRETGRVAKGVRIVDVSEGDAVASATVVDGSLRCGEADGTEESSDLENGESSAAADDAVQESSAGRNAGE